MFKKTKTIVAFVAFISSSGLSMAAGTPYIGGSVGTGSGISISKNYGFGYQPVIAHLFGGYGVTVGADQRWYLGGELDAHVSHSKSATNYGLAASFMPGIKVTQSTLIYTKLGLDSTIHKSTYFFQTQFGLGVQTDVTKKIALRGEYLTTAGSRGVGEFNVGLAYKFD